MFLECFCGDIHVLNGIFSMGHRTVANRAGRKEAALYLMLWHSKLCSSCILPFPGRHKISDSFKAQLIGQPTMVSIVVVQA